MPNEVLIDFHPELRHVLFKPNDASDLVEQADPTALTALRFPRLEGKLKWNFESEL